MEKDRFMDFEKKRAKQANREAWEKEHASPTLPGIASAQESLSVRKLMEYAFRNGIVLGTNVLDIGCGKGRNALFLAQHGFRVTAFDGSHRAIEVLKQRAQDADLAITTSVAAMDEPWPYLPNSFDVTIDDTASMSIGYEDGILVCRNEMHRVLRPGGYALIYSLADDDPFLLRFPKGSTPKTRVHIGTERLYSPEELVQLYAPFHLVHQEKLSVRDGQRKVIWTLFQKPS